MSESHGAKAGSSGNQMILDGHKERFRRSSSEAREFLSFLQKSEVGVWRVEQDVVPSRWWLNITLPANQQEVFGLHRELQVFFTDYEKVEPRSLSLIQNRVRKDLRVESDVAILVSRDKHAADTTRRRAGEMAVIAVDLDEVRNGDSPPLHTLIAYSVATVDHFNITTPVKDPSGFFGRGAEIEDIANDLRRGLSVGVFGLRKTGKTSLLNALNSLRAEEGSGVTIKVDVSEIVTAEQFRSRVLEGLWDALAQDADSGVRKTKLRSLAREGLRRLDILDSSSYWIQDIRHMLDSAPFPALLIIDEVDQAFPPRSNLDSEEAAGLFSSLVQLRSLLQEQDRLVLLCAGVDPALFEKSIINGKDNLLYKLVRLVWLAPMSREEMAVMVRSLGKRMGVRIRGHEEIDALYRQYGGHPLLTRKACSIAVRARTPDSLPFHITSSALASAIESREYGGPRDQATDILESFTEWFPDEAALLRLYFSRDGKEREYALELLQDDPDALQHSAVYGICFSDHTARILAVVEGLDS